MLNDKLIIEVQSHGDETAVETALRKLVKDGLIDKVRRVQDFYDLAPDEMLALDDQRLRRPAWECDQLEFDVTDEIVDAVRSAIGARVWITVTRRYDDYCRSCGHVAYDVEDTIIDDHGSVPTQAEIDFFEAAMNLDAPCDLANVQEGR